ncbi:MAG: hypothetical protein VX684_12330 [Planctomycetota bacterium]|nr:hypothetical protein [Planctomycetota bacterium]
MNRNRTWMLFVLSILIGALGPDRHSQAATIGDRDTSEARRIAESAQEAYQRGMETRAAAPEEAGVLFEESADGWRRLIMAGYVNPGTWTNLGNAELGAGRVGEAIAAYLEADRLAPGAPEVRSGLAIARNQVPARFDATGVTVLYDSVSDGWHVVGFELRWWIATASWVGFWALLAGVVAFRGRAAGNEGSEGGRLVLKSCLVGLAGIALISSGTVALDATEDAWRTPGVLVSESVVRSGNGQSFGEVFSEPLPEGVEFEVVESRPGWHRVVFADERGGWLRSDHVRVIDG